MAKNNMNRNAYAALQEWREANTGKDGKLDMKKILANKRKELQRKLKDAEAKVDAIKEKIAKIDNRQNKSAKSEILAKFTLEELKEKLGI